MLEARARLDLAQEALAHAGEVEVLGMDELERDHAAERLLAREVDDAHPAAAEPLEQVEVAEPVGEAILGGRFQEGSGAAYPARPFRDEKGPEETACSLPLAAPWSCSWGSRRAPRAQAPDEALLLRDPALLPDAASSFAHAGDLWRVALAGGDAQRLTIHPGVEAAPVASPDGKWIAFTGQYDGNPDVFVVAAGGGDPRRLTFHPGSDLALGFTA
jgi:hypothetical protein